MFVWWDPLYLIAIAPALLLMLWAQARTRSAFAGGMRVPANLSGAAAARYILDRAGLNDVGIETSAGFLSDHYDPRTRTVRLSPKVHDTRSAAAVGIAAHETGHAMQHANAYGLLIIRNLAVPAARFGPIAFMILVMLGMFFLWKDPDSTSGAWLIRFGILAYCGLLFFQVVNLPVEFDASRRAKRILTEYAIVDEEGAVAVNRVLNAAGWTYVAATLQTLLTLLYYLYRLGLLGGRR